MNLSKRIKSGLITLVSVLSVVLVSPEWVSFTEFANDGLVEMGIPLAIIGLAGVVISEIWKHILNWYMINKLEKTSSAGSLTDYKIDLY